MKVYTVIVTYNGVKWLEQCLKSIVNQSEVIVVDNNSTDETLNIINNNFPSVIVLPQVNNFGFGVANNIGISYALKNGADAVFLLNQDAFAQSGCIFNLIEASEKYPDYGIISPVHLNGDGSALDFTFQTITYMSKIISDLIFSKRSVEIYDFHFVNAAAWFLPKKTLMTVGGFDPIFFLYGEDDNYCQRAIYHGFKIGIISNATVHHDSNNSYYKSWDIGTENYFRHFVNSIYIKYANVNNDNFKKVSKFKRHLIRLALFSLLLIKTSSFKLFLLKYRKIKTSVIYNSVLKNRNNGSHYLEI